MIFNEVDSLTKASKAPQQKDKSLLIGLYYDDPESIPENELRFAIGTVLSSGK